LIAFHQFFQFTGENYRKIRAGPTLFGRGMQPRRVTKYEKDVPRVCTIGRIQKILKIDLTHSLGS
jgi:hypothetical protein